MITETTTLPATLPGKHLVRIHYPSLDGLRGLAIILVILYHNFNFISYFNYGWLGVDLFFVLSGFLITNILLDTEPGVKQLGNFYVRRALRITPLYYLCLVIFLLILPRLPFNTINFSYYVTHQAWFWTYQQNFILMASDSTENTKALHHFWSLAVEEQYYLFWPLLVFIFKDLRMLLVILFLSLGALIGFRTFIWIHQINNFNYFGFYTFTRIDGLLLGSMIPIFQRLNMRFLEKFSSLFIFSLAFLNFIFYYVNKAKGFTFPYFAIVGYATFSGMFAFLVYELSYGRSVSFKQLFQFRFLIFLGKISYGVYLIHWPVYVIFQPVIARYISLYASNSFLINTLSSAISTILAIILSIGIYYGIERNFLRLKKYFNPVNRNTI